jgi:hypothetical protein
VSIILRDPTGTVHRRVRLGSADRAVAGCPYEGSGARLPDLKGVPLERLCRGCWPPARRMPDGTPG